MLLPRRRRRVCLLGDGSLWCRLYVGYRFLHRISDDLTVKLYLKREAPAEVTVFAKLYMGTWIIPCYSENAEFAKVHRSLQALWRPSSIKKRRLHS
jgi:hypothetical protein